MGSEMCIRDSICACRRAPRVQPRARLSAHSRTPSDESHRMRVWLRSPESRHGHSPRRAAPPRATAYLVTEFNAENMTGLNAEAQAAQESVCALPRRYEKLAERSMKGIMAHKEEDLVGKFSWLHRPH